MSIENLIPGRNNNFNLIRLLAAFSVLISHSFALTGNSEPLFETLGMTLGTFAVDIFFITSGFLVTNSLNTKNIASDYMLSRVMRIFPGLIVVTFFCVFVVGPIFTALPLFTYFSTSEIYIFLLKGSTVLAGIPMYLPGVFADNPFKSAVNGSLWTLIYEVQMYVILLLAWVLVRVCGRFFPSGSLKLHRLLFLLTLLSGAIVVINRFAGNSEYYLMRFVLMFFSGASFCLYAKYIILSTRVFCVVCVGMFCAIFAGKNIFLVIYLIGISYVLFYLAYIPGGFLRKFNQFGDYSYGIYIYAFPVQQSVVALFPGILPFNLIYVSSIVTFVCSVISWHVIEKPILGRKEQFLTQWKNTVSKLRFKLN